jgi:hypothetical protein
MVGWLAFILSAIVAATLAAPASAQDLFAQLFPVTGEVRLVNKGAADIPFVFYSIDSTSGALDSSSAVWHSITRTYDRPAGATPGNGIIDPNGDWIELLQSNQLAEGALDADAGSLSAFRAISLGHIWDPFATPFPDLQFEVWNETDLIPITVELALDGDYSADSVVDGGDFIVWQKFIDSMTAYFADGDLDGVVDMDDFVVWQQNYGFTLPLPPYVVGPGGGGAGIANPVGAPEPSTALLILVAAGSVPFAVGRRRRS